MCSKKYIINTSSIITSDFEMICWECHSINCNKINLSKIKDNEMGYMLITPKELFNFKIEKIKDDSLKKIIQEFYYTVSLTFLSSAVMLGKKMHIAVNELKAKDKESYVK